MIEFGHNTNKLKLLLTRTLAETILVNSEKDTHANYKLRNNNK